MNPPCRGVMALCLTAVVTACGISAQQTPTRVPAEQVPYGLLDTAPPTTTPPSGPTPVSIYLVGPDGRLTPVTRQVPTARPSDTLDALLAAPSDGDIAAGLTTSLVGLTAAVRQSGRIAVVDLGELPPAATDKIQTPCAQIVYTLTALEGIDAVRFTLDGDPVAVPQGDGSLTETPVGRASYPE